MKTSTILLTVAGSLLAGVATFLVVKKFTEDSSDENLFDRLGGETPQSHIRGIMHRSKEKAVQSSVE